jgi:hypothetical protein
MAAKTFPPEFGRASQMIEIELLEKRCCIGSIPIIHAVLEARAGFRPADRKPAHAHV